MPAKISQYYGYGSKLFKIEPGMQARFIKQHVLMDKKT